MANRPGVLRGNLIMKLEEEKGNNDFVNIRVSANDLEDVSGWLGSFKPMLYLSKVLQNGSTQRIYTSKPMKGKSVTWDRFELPLQLLTSNDMSTTLIAEAYDYHRNGSHKFIAKAEFTAAEVTEEGKRQIKLVNPKKIGGKKKGNAFMCGASKYSHSGHLRFLEFDIHHKPHFLDYIAGGCQINLVAAVDFTASNMNP
jgi:hypothetical protein